MKLKQVIVVRKDLKLTKGKLAAQVAHAAVGAAEKTRKTRNEWFKKWLAEGQKKAVVRASSEDELRELCSVATKVGLSYQLVEDLSLIHI